MAIGLQNFPNIIAPNSDFLSGRIKDNPGDGSGTPVNQLTNGDLQEFFSRLMVYAGLTPNDMPDSEYTGHQYIQALTKRIFHKASSPIIESLIGGYTANDLIILEGVVITLTNSNNTATWTAGWIYYNDITYYVAAGTLTKTNPVFFLYQISDTDDFHITISSGTSGTGIADYGAASVKTLVDIMSGRLSISAFVYLNSYSNGGLTGSTGRYKIDSLGNVTLMGVIAAPSSVSSLLFTILPLGFRPSTPKVFATIVSGATTGAPAYCQVDADGTCAIYLSNSSYIANSSTFTLDGITFNIKD